MAYKIIEWLHLGQYSCKLTVTHQDLSTEIDRYPQLFPSYPQKRPVTIEVLADDEGMVHSLNRELLQFRIVSEQVLNGWVGSSTRKKCLPELIQKMEE